MYEDWIQPFVGPVPADRRGLCDQLALIGRARAVLDAREAKVLAAIDGLDDSGASAAAVARSRGPGRARVTFRSCYPSLVIPPNRHGHSIVTEGEKP